MALSLAVALHPCPSTVCDDPSLRLARNKTHENSKTADDYASLLSSVANFTGASWRIEGVGVVCCTGLDCERILSMCMQVFVRLRDTPFDMSVLAESICILRKTVELSGAWPPQISSALSVSTTLERCTCMEMMIHVSNLAGSASYAHASTHTMAEQISGVWRSVYETLSRSADALRRSGEEKGGEYAGVLSRECLSHAAGAAAEAAFKTAKFSLARQLAATALSMRATCPFASDRLEMFDMVATEHGVARLDALDEPALVRVLPPRVALIPVIV